MSKHVVILFFFVLCFLFFLLLSYFVFLFSVWCLNLMRVLDAGRWERRWAGYCVTTDADMTYVVAPLLKSVFALTGRVVSRCDDRCMENYRCVAETQPTTLWAAFSTRCTECRRRLAMRIMSVCLSVPLNVNFALSKPLLGAAALPSRIVTNALFASQLLQWNIKLLTMFIIWTNWGVWMRRMIAD